MEQIDNERQQKMIPFCFLFAQDVELSRDGEQTGGAETETQTSYDGIVRTDTEEDEDVDS
ncbi:MAG: hypothetical protein IMW89_10700 [Ktedonobacteraceae bacterium]|nr:hypothetical protein [Ktedonobacteraceae bacterium]